VDLILSRSTRCVPEKQMVFRFVPKLAVSTRLIPGRVALVRGFTFTDGGIEQLFEVCDLEWRNVE
jgi:hypothetical protein